MTGVYECYTLCLYNGTQEQLESVLIFLLIILTKTVALTVSFGLFQMIHIISTAVFHRYLVRLKTLV